MSKIDVELRGDLWYPTKDKCLVGCDYTIKDLDEHVYPLVAEKGIVVQAGGSVGIWPRHMANHFKTVYTFEPQPESFHCLTMNCMADNVIKFQAGLGSSREFITVGWPQKPENYGAYQPIGEGITPVMTIDELDLPRCDLIMLDIEGYEYFALQGAAQTLAKFKPVVVIENKPGCLTRYGLNIKDCPGLMAIAGYKVHKTFNNNRDMIFLPE